MVKSIKVIGGDVRGKVEVLWILLDGVVGYKYEVGGKFILYYFLR